MKGKRTRPQECEPGYLTDTKEMGRRLRLSKERLEASDLADKGQAWRMWAACVEATFSYAREADQTYAQVLARSAANMDRSAASRILRRFDELGVFGWEPAPLGSHGMSLLRLPALHAVPAPHEELHAVPTPHVGGSTRGPDAALHNSVLLTNAHESSSNEDRDGSSLDGFWRAEEVNPPAAAPDDSLPELGDLLNDAYAPRRPPLDG